MQGLKEKKKEKRARQKVGVKKMMLYVVLLVSMVPVNVCVVYAANEVTAPLNNLKTLILSIIGAVGIIILAKNVMEFAQSYQQQDSSSMNSAIKGIVAGLIMAAISSVITFLGL